MNQNNDNMDNQTFVWVAVALIILLVIPAIYAAKAGYINEVLLSLSCAQLKVFFPFSDEVRIAARHIEQLDPASLSWEQMQGILRYTGKWIRWPWLVALLLFGGVALLLGRTGRLVRRFNMETLLQNNAKSFPCLKPVVGRGKYLLSPESYDSGLWKVARTPLQFAVEHKLLLDVDGKPVQKDKVLKHGLAMSESDVFGRLHLDESRVIDVLTSQLGPAFSGYEGLSPCRRAAAAAFLSYAHGDKKACIAILDTVSCAYSEDNGVASCSVLEQEAFVKKLEKSWKKAADVLGENIIIRHCAYELPWFMALLTRARQKGVLAGSQFLWLRPLDRPLWYALNQCGGRTAWIEGVAPWAHYMAEEKAGSALSEPCLTQAFTGLRKALADQGWLTEAQQPDDAPSAASDSQEKATGSSSSGAAPVSAASAAQDDTRKSSRTRQLQYVYADADDDPEYDVNNDPTIQNQQF